MSIQSIFGSIAFVTSVIGLLPQIIKSLRTRSTTDISMAMLINYFICSFAWIVYGGYTDASFVLYSNIFGLLTCIMLIVMKVKFDKHEKLS